MREYPQVLQDNLQTHGDALRFIAQQRLQDIQDNNNLKNIFMSGRKVGKTPASSSDVASTDNVGDFNYDTNYLYLLVTGGVWRRIALGTW